jgi:hypothetical protein
MTLAYFFLTKMGRCSVRLVQESFPLRVVEYDFECGVCALMVPATLGAACGLLVVHRGPSLSETS